jgi:hypothetical protein
VTFTIIAQKLMGKLSASSRRELKRIETQRATLVEQLKALDDAEQELLLHTTDQLKIDTEGPFRGIHITDAGEVHAMYCTCPPCQAELNGVGVVEATEIMIERGFIHADQADTMRRQARLDAAQRKSTMVH